MATNTPKAEYLQHGLTLVEMSFVLGIISLVATWGFPSLENTLMSVRAQGVSAAMSTDLAWARLAAVTRGRPTQLCPSVDGTSCSPTNHWNAGWIGFVDDDGNHQPSATETIAIRHEALSSGVRLSSSPGRLKIRFLPDGRSAGSNATLEICTHERLRSSVIVNNVGRVRTERFRAAFGCRIDQTP